jgi:NAD(P)-dependent dehydrogenase (short-subunit alcohol dehydrogenase family)
MPTTTIDKPHAGRVALVTGAARGIGQAVAVGLAERGASVVLDDIGEPSETAELIADSGGSALAVSLDISDLSVIDAARGRVADELGRIDILVNNAAIFEAATRDGPDFELWQRIMSVNLNGPMLICQAFLPLMSGRGWGPRHQRGLRDHRDRKPRLDRLPDEDARDRLRAGTVGDVRRRENHDQRRPPGADPHRK